MAETTGEKLPTLGAGVSETPWNILDWVDPTLIYGDDDQTASITDNAFDSGIYSYVLKATGFDFSTIPDNATIVGVVCRANTWRAVGNGGINLLQLLDTQKNKVGANLCTVASGLGTVSSDILTVGDATNLWGNALTPSWVKNSSFGVAVGGASTGNNCDMFIDYVTLEIYYTAPGADVFVAWASDQF